MPEFVKPVTLAAAAVVAQYAAAELSALGRENFVTVDSHFAGVEVNLPAAWVIPLRTSFAEDAQHSRAQRHELRVIVGIAAADPQDLDDLAMDYVAAVDRALQAADTARAWEGKLANGIVLRVFVASHEYGPLIETTHGIARFPTLELLIETEENL